MQESPKTSSTVQYGELLKRFNELGNLGKMNAFVSALRVAYNYRFATGQNTTPYNEAWTQVLSDVERMMEV